MLRLRNCQQILKVLKLNGWVKLIDSKSILNEVIKSAYEPKNNDSDYDDLFNNNFYEKYDDDFFEKNILYYAYHSLEYAGSIGAMPYIDIKNCYYSAEKNSILIKANITSKIEHIDNGQPALSCEPQYSPRGYVIEFPREMFDDNNLDYTDFMIFYLNYEDEKYFLEGSDYWKKNVQIGLNKYGRAINMHKYEPGVSSDSIIDRG